MTFAELDGEPLASIICAALADEIPREEAHRALLDLPVCVPSLGPGAPPGPSLKLGEQAVRLVESVRLGAPVVPLYVSGAAMVAGASDRRLWPDDQPRGEVFDRGAIFPLLRGHPGALVIVRAGEAMPLDAGDVAALAEKQSPSEYATALRKLVAAGRPREAAGRLATRPVYTLGHPSGGMLMFQRELPVFLHLASAEGFAARVSAQTGGRLQHGLVSAAELFKNAVRGKLFVLIDPGPTVIRLRPEDMR